MKSLATFVNESIDRQFTVFHGSDSKFSQFDSKYIKRDNYGKGFYFTDDEEAAKHFGKYLAICKIKGSFVEIGGGRKDQRFIDKIEELTGFKYKDNFAAMQGFLREVGESNVKFLEVDIIIVHKADKSMSTEYVVYNKDNITIDKWIDIQK
jgi:hypothetical protein